MSTTGNDCAGQQIQIMAQAYKTMLHNISVYRGNIFFALLSGFLLTCIFPKVGADWLAWIALMPLLLSIKGLSPKLAFYIGLLSGIAHYLTLLYWLVPVMKTYGHLPMVLSICTLMVFAFYLALYVALFTVIMARFGVRPLPYIVLAPAAWVALEYLRSFLFTGFPWGLLGHSQFNRLSLIQLSDITGVFGISFLIVLMNAVGFFGLLHLNRNIWQGHAISRWLSINAAVVSLLMVFMVIFYGTWRIKSIDVLQKAARFEKITVVQGNIDQSIKWDPAHKKKTMEKYINLSLSAKADQPDLVVWPETATPFYFLSRHRIELTRLIQKGIRASGAYFLIGTPSIIRRGQGVDFYNSAYLVDPHGKKVGQYDKVHLVPYGEYVPFKKWLPFLGKIVSQAGDFTAGEKGSTVSWKDMNIGIQICFEIIFPTLTRAMTLENNASFFVNITNDAWFGTTSGPYQHFSMTIFRAVENRRSLIRSANTGISGFIDPVGRVIASSPLLKDAVLTRKVPIMEIKTIYTAIGDLFAQFCFMVTAVMIFSFRKTHPGGQ